MGHPALPLGRGRRFAKISVVVFFDAGFGRFGLIFGRGLSRRGGSGWCGGYRAALPQLAAIVPDGVIIPLIRDAVAAIGQLAPEPIKGSKWHHCKIQ